MTETVELPALRAALARAVRAANQHPSDKDRARAVIHARERYAEARTIALIGSQLDGVPLSMASRRRIAVTAGLIDDTVSVS